MAHLRDLRSDDLVPLAARTLVGRAGTAQLVVSDLKVSGEHATISWTGSGWEVRDLGSRNGTFLGGARLASGASAPLRPGARLAFGDEGRVFVLEDAGAPGAMARDRAGRAVFARDGFLALPSPEQPVALVFVDAAARFVCEIGDERRPVTNGQTIEAGGGSWTLQLPQVIEGTAAADAAPTLDTVTLRFEVSRDEEHVRIALVHRGRSTPIEPREHGYVLLTLARRRLEDAAEPAAEQGWVDRDTLLRMLQLDANGLNVAIYRARGQLAAAGLTDAAAIVEVRRGQRRLGIDPSRLAIGPMS